MLGEFASLKSKHDGGDTEANQPNLLNVIANTVKQSLKATQNVIANEMKQSFQLHNNGLPRRYAPRNDDVVASNGLPRRYAPRNDDVVACNGLPRRYAPRNDDVVACNGLPRRYAPRNDDCNVCGRSMIEMLGVLAIIGVLSVGGIAGYSKAMLMWHSNKQRDLLVTLINNAITLKPHLYADHENRTQDITGVFYAIGAIPEGFTYKNNNIYDADNNPINITYGVATDHKQDGSPVKIFKYAIRIFAKENTGKISISMKEYCKNLIMIANTVQNEIQHIDFMSSNSSSWTGLSNSTIFNGKAIDQTPVQINNRCNIAIKESGIGYFRIMINQD